jgi:polar amino acid transport system permease protein
MAWRKPVSDFIELIDTYRAAMPLLLRGCLTTIFISAVGIFFGFLFGLVVGVLDSNRIRNKWLSPFLRCYVAIFRGTPLFVQLLIVYFALPEVLGLQLSPIAAGIITLGLNSTAYLGEVIRSGINAIDRGQWDASYILGYSTWQSLRYIILPQSLRAVLPAITNEFASLIKESSILMVIGVPELTKLSKDIVAHNLKPMEIYALAALFYLMMTYVVALLTKRLEGKGQAWS